MKTTHPIGSPAEAKGCAAACGSLRKTQQIEGLMHLMAEAHEKAVLFEVEGDVDSRVCIAGTFNDWNPMSHPLEYHPEDGVFRATLLLGPGVHEYKFVINGEWRIDTRCPNWVLKDDGTLNSVIKVEGPTVC